MKTKRTIMIVAPYFPPHVGGLERYAHELATQLSQNHERNVVVVTTNEKHQEDSLSEEGGFKVYRLAYDFKISNTPYSFSWPLKLWRIFADERPEVINVHTPVPGMGDWVTWMAGRIPVVVTYHAGSMIKHRFSADVLIWIYEHSVMHFMLNKARAIICSSNFIRDDFLARYRYKSVTVTPAVNTRQFTPDIVPKQHDAPALFFAASLGVSESYKGLDTLIEVFPKLKQRFPRLKLIVAGDGNMKDGYVKRAQQLAIADALEFRGKLHGSELVNAYNDADIFVLPTRNDSTPTVIIEAMACALPVVSTTVGGIPQLVDDGLNGFLIPPGDGDALVSRIADLLSNAELRTRMGMEARKKIIKTYQWEERATYYLEILDRAVGRSSRGVTTITIVAPYFAPKIGGVENYVQQISQSLSHSGKYRVSIITSNSTGEGYRQDTIQDVTVHRLPISFKVSNTPINFIWYLWIKKILRFERPDIINAHSPVSYMADMAALAAGTVPLVLTYHSGKMSKGKAVMDFIITLYEKLFLPLLFKKATAIVAASSTFTDNLLRQWKDKTVFITPSVDLERFAFTDLPEQLTRVTYVGRIEHSSEWKGVATLLKAFKMVNSEMPEATLELVGAGDAAQFYLNMAKNLGIARAVTLSGALTGADLVRAYQRSSVIVLPSLTDAESFGMVLIEAMATGRPVIGSRIGGIPNVIDDNKNGILVSPGNEKELSSAILRILSHRALAEQYGKCGREKAVLQFGNQVQFARYDQLYSSLLARPERNIEA